MIAAQALGTCQYLFWNILWLSGLMLGVRCLPLGPQGGWVLGLEDILFAFNVGATACLAAIWLYRHQLTAVEQPRPRIARVLAIGIPAQCAFLAMYSIFRSGIGSMILEQLMAVVPALQLRRDLWRFSAAGGIGFPLIYRGILRTVFWIWPGFVSCWKSTPPWGVLLFGVPLGEVAWAFGFGLFWPLFAGYVFDLRLSTGRQVYGRTEAALTCSYGQGT